MEPRTRRRGNKRLLAMLVLIAAGAAWVLAWRIGPEPSIQIEAGLPGIGRQTPVRVVVEEPSRGIGSVRVELVQEGRVTRLAEAEHEPRPPWKLWGPRTARTELEVEVGSDTVEGLEEGEAVVRASVERAGAWLRRPDPAVSEIRLPVRLTPPVLGVLSTQHYVAQGGSGVVVYSVGESSVRDGVQSGDRFFPGYELPGGGPRQRFAPFGVPFDLVDGNRVQLVAEDDVGNRSTQSFVDRFFPSAFSTDTIEVSEGFMERVVPAILANTPGLSARDSLLESYLLINGELRRRNAQTLDELAEGSRREFLWSRSFLPMPNAQVMSSFADRRTYLYDGEEVDRQDHLGYDLASIRRAEIPAANDGVVALARYFGIYGNAVVLDHGYGLASLYGHLSTIDVAEGQTVARGDLLGRSGETGLAGGDHLHFTMLLRGLPVNAVEWWDGAWIRDRIAAKLGGALDYQP